MLAAVLLVAFNSTSAFAATTGDTSASVDASSASTPRTSATPPADVATATSDASNAAPAAATQAPSDVHAAALATEIAVAEHPDLPQPALEDSNGASYLGPAVAGTPDGVGAVTYGGVSFTDVPPSAASWVWDGTSWSQVCLVCDPGPRGFSGIATDLASTATGVVMYGGSASFGSAGLADTWIFADGAWTELCASCPPGPRLGPAMAGGGPAGDQVLLFGGAAAFGESVGSTVVVPATGFNDTWGFDGVTWTQLDAGGPSAPVERIGASMAWDGTQFILFGGGAPQPGGAPPIPIDDGTWIWGGDHWTQACANAAVCGPAPRVIPRMAFLDSTDPSRRGVLLVGGLTFSNDPTAFGDIWFWHDGQWVQQVSPWLDEQSYLTPTGPLVFSGGLASAAALCQVSLVGQGSSRDVSTFSLGLDTDGDGVIDPCPVVPPPTPTPTPTPTPDNVVVPAAGTSPAAAETTAAGTLPFTGSDLGGPMTFATTLIGTGLVLVAASRRQRVCRRARSNGMD
jgi:hypothetical protein